jgi:hypothetical protein
MGSPCRLHQTSPWTARVFNYVHSRDLLALVQEYVRQVGSVFWDIYEMDVAYYDLLVPSSF